MGTSMEIKQAVSYNSRTNRIIIWDSGTQWVFKSEFIVDIFLGFL